MYHTHFGLHEEPFGVTPDRLFFDQTPQHREAVATLLDAVQQRRGFALPLGCAGLGKTTVLHTLVQMLKSSAEVAYLANPYYDRATVLDSILASLGQEPGASPAASHQLFYQYLVKTQGAGRTVVVILDEAQDLHRDTLEAIRMLSNFETPAGKLVQLVLAGQPRLAETLKQPDCEQIRQRFGAIACLEPLNSREIRDYIVHRLQIAGGSIDRFTTGAVRMIASRIRWRSPQHQYDLLQLAHPRLRSGQEPGRH